MDFLLNNSLTRQLEKVFASDGKTLRFYCCGPTVYGSAHIGNFRTFVLQDIFRRVCELSGISTTHVRNITDVDDKTIQGAILAKQTLQDFTQSWKPQFEQDALALNLLEPHYKPSAVEHIPQQIEMIQRLLEKGFAYQASDQSVYFNIESFKDYGKLSKLQKNQSLNNAMGRLEDEYSKDNLADFVLWKAWKPEDGRNHWDSPWGKGRPGWHIECSTMSCHYLGNSFDLHSGGIDLIFPHHENEIAQSECATGKPFVRHWFHIMHLMVNGEKMSKSLGNLYTLADLAEKGFSAGEVRYVLLSGHYRKPLNFTFESLSNAQMALNRLQKCSDKLSKIATIINIHQETSPIDPSFSLFQPAWEALLNDLNTPEALGQLFIVIRKIEKLIQAQDIDAQTAQTYYLGLRNLLYSLGIVLPENTEVIPPNSIQVLAQQRWQAKQNRDWKLADQLRKQLLEQGWLIEDTSDQYHLKPSKE